MPRPAVLKKSLKSVCVDSVLFFAMFALVGHLTINFWEKYAIQNELVTMKHSLHSMKDTITNIGKAYDNLYTELRELFIMVDQDHPCLEQKEPNARCKNVYNFSHRGLHDLQVQTVITSGKQMKVGVGVTTESSKLIEPHGHENKATGPLGKNATTNTKNPPVDTGTTTDQSFAKITHIHTPKYIHSHQNRRRYYKNLEHRNHVCRRSIINSKMQ